MDDVLLQLGVGGIFAILVIREVLSFFGKRPAQDDSNFPTWLRIQLQQAVTQLSKDMQTQTEAMKDIRDALTDINKTLFGISGEYEHIRSKMTDMTTNIHKVLDERSKRRGNGN